jgi:DNA adenine methylase
MSDPPTPHRAALRYYGGKWRLAPWIIAHFPAHTCYVEPFGGAASVLLQKRPAKYEVWNDLEHDVVTFFTVLRERPGPLLRLLNATPFARAELDEACRPEADWPAVPHDADLERARRVFVRAWQGRHGLPARGQMGWRFERDATRSRTVVQEWFDTEHLHAVSDRFRQVQIESDDALKVIARFDGPDALFYVDPPYPAATRDRRWRDCAYNHEYTDDQHRALAAVLHAVRGMVVLSGYACPLYAEELYPDWRLELKPTTTHNSKPATEALWLSPRTAARLGSRQLGFVDDAAEAAE